MKRLVSTIGFALILAPVLVVVPWSYAGLIVVALFALVFAPRDTPPASDGTRFYGRAGSSRSLDWARGSAQH